MNLTLKVWRQANAEAKGIMETYPIADVSVLICPFWK